MADDELDAGTKDRAYYTQVACQNAFGTSDVSAFDPAQGFPANRDRMLQLYTYYQTTAQKAPDQFLWIGLGHLAGATIVSGLDQGQGTAPEIIAQTLLGTAMGIFLDLAYLHEAYLDSPQTALDLAAQRDAVDPRPAASYGTAWTDIASGDPDRVTAGNVALLRNEQACLVQPGMDTLSASNVDWAFNRSRAFTLAVHPYHRDFIKVLPSGSVASFDDRWAWIMETDGMWAKWLAMPSVAPDERNRLIALSLSDLMSRNFAPVVQALLPTGADDE